MIAIAIIKEFLNIECDEVREGEEIALSDAIERVHTMQLAYEINVEMKACERAQERYNELAK